MTSALPVPGAGPEEATAWVRTHLGHLTLEEPGDIRASTAFRGGQSAADAALATYDVSGYAARRNEVWPPERRAASRLSPYIRHGLLPLRRVWDHVAGGPPKDVRKLRDELLWQEYARHVYARLGTRTRHSLRFAVPDEQPAGTPAEAWDPTMACLDLTVGELERDGWLVNQTRMWLASHWTVRGGWGWRSGEDAFFAHLLDGSRAANRLGWQWTVGAGTGKPYGFSRWQVERRAPGLCARCPLRDGCPVQDWPDTPAPPRADPPDAVRRDPDPSTTTGPAEALVTGEPEAVWLTAESLGDDDPALQAHPDLPAVFVVDEPLLRRLRLSGKRLVFLAETLADLATRRPLEVHLGDPRTVLAGRALAVTHAPVPGFHSRSAALRPVAVHPWPWLVPPHSGPVTSYSAWRQASTWPAASR